MRTILIHLPPDMERQFADLGFVAGTITFRTATPITPAVVSRARDIALRLDAEAQLGGGLVKTILADDGTDVGDIYEEMQVRAVRLCLLGSGS